MSLLQTTPGCQPSGVSILARRLQGSVARPELVDRRLYVILADCVYLGLPILRLGHLGVASRWRAMPLLGEHQGNPISSMAR